MGDYEDINACNLIYFLEGLLESNCPVLENTYFEKLLTLVKSLLDSGKKEYLFKELPEFYCHSLKKWMITSPAVHILEFFTDLFGILCKNEQIFCLLNEKNAVYELMDVLHQNFSLHKSLHLAYVRVLKDVLSHTSGYGWIKTSKEWICVIQMCFSNSHLVVDRESKYFTAELIKKSQDGNLVEEIIKEILHPISKKENINFCDKNFCLKMCISFRLLESVLKVHNETESNIIWQKLNKNFDMESFLKFVLENCSLETVQDAGTTLFILFSIAKYGNKFHLLSMQHIPASILEVFNILLRKNQINGIIKLAKYCQIIWSEMRNKLKCQSQTVIHFIVLQLVPVIIYNKNPPNTKIFDLYVQKLFDLTSESTQKFGYSLRDTIKKTKDSHPRDWAIKSIISVAGNIKLLSQDEAVIIFQSAAYALKIFVCETRSDETSVTSNNCYEKDLLCITDAPLLSAVLNTLCVIIENFKINWTESLESLGLLKMTCNLLENRNLSGILVVQALLLVKLAINNFMSPNLALLMNTSEDSILERLMDLLYKRMHDPNWEVRDSCIEVIVTITEFGESKYPAFQQLLKEKNFCSLVFSILEDDSNSYVRASALRALSAMVNIQSLNHSLCRVNLTSKAFEILQNESEGIVRREAAILIRQIYLIQDETSDISNSFYRIMSYSAICDLHWEVKVNSLLFWEAVIQRIMANQGMIDGSFPKVTFSKEYKKIVTLTNDEIKLRLNKILTELSKIGCLFVLLSTLNDDCDIQVVQKSADILKHLMSILMRYNFVKIHMFEARDKFPVKRRNTGLYDDDKRKTSDFCSFDDISGDNVLFNGDKISDDVIEEIINETDLNLLVNVYRPSSGNSFLNKNFIFQEIKPETFLCKMRDVDFDSFLEEKHKCLNNTEVDLKFLTYEINKRKLVDETNVMDCY